MPLKKYPDSNKRLITGPKTSKALKDSVKKTLWRKSKYHIG